MTQIALAPWQEEAHRTLMRLLAVDGRRSAALAQYETCRRALARELDVEPSAETIALYERIRDHKMRTESATLFKQLQSQAQVFNVLNDASLQQQYPGVAALVNGRSITELQLSEECIARHGKEVLEGEINLADAFGSVPDAVYIAAISYGTGADPLNSQGPHTWNSDNNIDTMEFLRVPIASIRDEDLDGHFDGGSPEMWTVVNNNTNDANNNTALPAVCKYVKRELALSWQFWAWHVPCHG